MNYSRNITDEFKRFFRSGSTLSILILINILIWVLTKVAYVLFFLYNHPDSSFADSWILHYFALPANPGDLSSRPWTLVTYMFLHLEFWHILFNLLWLYWFGRIFLEYLSSRQLLFTYLTGGLAGGLLYIIAFNIFPVFHSSIINSVALGASASVMAIVTAISFYVPNYSIQLLFIGRIRIIYLAIVLFIFDFIAIPGGNAGGHIAHIGGAFFGYFMSLYFRKTRYTYSTGVFSSIFKRITTAFKTRFKKQPSTPYSGRPKTDEDYNDEKNLNQKRIDYILEKISRGGYESLTKEEKEFLFRSSGKNR
ncbi:MAG: rhomboid family intramembrane serine protease [Bacteroidales bacterium]